MRILVVEHDHVSPLGPVAERLAERGHELVHHLVVPAEHHHAPGVQADFPAVTDYDAVVTMGARWSTYDVGLIGSWVLPEIELLRSADEEGIPVLGICFGGQLLAAAHGGSVVLSDAPEIGWTTIDTDDEALVSAGPWFHWHFDRWELPPDAREVARNGAASQAFTLRRNLAVQFHPELTPAMLRGWLSNGGDEMLRLRGLDADAMVSATEQEAAAASRRTHALVDAFLDRVAASDTVQLPTNP
jgi:GMP synthase-like glutamine amidotransferase